MPASLASVPKETFTSRISDESLRKAEAVWIARFRAEFAGYKMLNRRGRCPTTNRGLSWKLKPLSISHKRKVSQSNKLRFSDPTERAKQSARIKKLWRDPAYRAKILAARKLTVDTEAHREMLRKRAKKQWKSGAMTEESHRKMSEARKAYWASR